ncbi:MAG: hypothetical protein K5931_00900 [Lachnospiraceae bacterium]|nr:hypothetical protein [Lachnospiraceae bacterium]
MIRSRGRRRGRKRLLLIILISLLFVLLMVFAIVSYNSSVGTISLKDFYTAELGGYNNKGSLIMEFNSEKAEESFNKLKASYSKRLIKAKVDPEKYMDLIKSISVQCTRDHNLVNGQSIGLMYDCDRELAKELRVKVTGTRDEFTVSGLRSAVFITYEDLFKDLVVTFSGRSPNITLTISNNSTNSYIRNMLFKPLEDKEFYTEGESVKIRAFYSEEDAESKYYSIDTPSESCVKEYIAKGESSYLTDGGELTDEIIKEAVEAGKKAFNHASANEFGVRIFTEAALVPVYDAEKDETFNWVNPYDSTIYFKSLKDQARGGNGTDYNQLDIVYIASLTQADGVSTKAFCAIRYSNIVRNSDGSLEYDFSDPKIISASHIAERVRKNVVTNFEGEYDIEKLK